MEQFLALDGIIREHYSRQMLLYKDFNTTLAEMAEEGLERWKGVLRSLYMELR